jgi:hypothetical protein
MWLSIFILPKFLPHRLSQVKQRMKPSVPPNPQASVLRRELAAVEKQTIFEAHRRAEAEQTLEREQRAAVPPEHAASMLRRDEEIQRIRDEKAAMTEWLQRGVAEADRIAQQIELLAEAQAQAVATAEDLRKENAQLVIMERRLAGEFQEASAKLISVREHRDILLSEAQHVSNVVGTTTNVISEVVQNKQTLEDETEKVKLRMRDCEVVEIAVSCLAAGVRRTLHELEILNNKATVGEHVEDSDEDEDFDSGDDETGGSVFPPAQLTASRAHISRCDALLATMASCLNRFGADQSLRELQKRRNHQELLREMKAELQDLRDRSDYHIKKLIEESRRREPLLRQYLELRNERMAKHSAQLASGTGVVSVEPFNLLAILEQENAELQTQRDERLAEYKDYKTRADSAEADYRSVKEMKRLYRELETQKTMLSHEVRSAEQDNKARKLQLWGVGPVTAVAAAANKTGSGQKQPWRAVQSQY